jgi:Spy/CpxP family protein refolding chaperone
MKKVLLVCALALGVSAASFAQGGMRATPEQQIERLKTSITGITDAQSAKLLVIYQARAKSMDSLRTAANGDRDAMRQAMMPMRKATNEKVKAVLTPEQATAFDKWQQEMADRMRQGGGGSQN